MEPASRPSPHGRPENHPLVETADIFRAHGKAYRNAHPLNPEQLQAMRDIERCRTAALGGHVEVCEKECGHFLVSYNSCRNRHCPKCQSLQGLKWVEQRLERLLPTHYFHLVITLPHELNPLIAYNKRLLLGMFFQTASRALLNYALTWPGLGAHIGFTAVLHTWNQDLLFHPHLHIIATGGGLDPSLTRWIASRLNFLVPVKALSHRVRQLFCDALEDAFAQGKLALPDSLAHLGAPEAFRRFIRQRRRRKWVVYCKEPFGGPEQFLKYIGRYTHRVAISNHRIISFSDGRVVFEARDNHNPGKPRTVILTADEFIRRFLMHILPTGFVKIRHYGIMAPSNANTRLKLASALIAEKPGITAMSAIQGKDRDSVPTWRERLREFTGIDLTVCPRCGARMVRMALSSSTFLRIQEEAFAVNSS